MKDLEETRSRILLKKESMKNLQHLKKSNDEEKPSRSNEKNEKNK